MKTDQLIGTYKLVCWENRDLSGEVTSPFGSDAQGVISYSADGHVFVHLMANGRKLHKSAEVLGGDPEEIKNSAITHLSYFGTFEVEANEVVHSIEIASFPNWVETEQRREIEFIDDHLCLTAHGVQVGDQKVSAHLVWHKV